MTSYAELLNLEVGSVEGYGSKFKLCALNSLSAINAAFRRLDANLSSKLMRVYVPGGMETGTSHYGYFSEAIKELGLQQEWKIEYITLTDIRGMPEWDHPHFLVDWCLESNFHVVLCQGIHSGMLGLWKPAECQEEMLRLQMHPGFPTGLNVQCPVVNADKFQYLCATKDHCLPSFKIPLIQDNAKLLTVMDSLKQFLSIYQSFDGEGVGFILKAPYVQNSKGFPLKRFKNYDEFILLLKGIYTNASKAIDKINVYSTEVFPYLIVQPRMKDKSESKIILWNGKAQYICFSSSPCISMKLHSKKKMMDFAEDAWRSLVERTRGAFLSDGICRVDLFSTQKGRLVVNEFESLDAAFYGGRSEDEFRTAQFLTNYYGKKLMECLELR